MTPKNLRDNLSDSFPMLRTISEPHIGNEFGYPIVQLLICSVSTATSLKGLPYATYLEGQFEAQ